MFIQAPPVMTPDEKKRVIVAQAKENLKEIDEKHAKAVENLRLALWSAAPGDFNTKRFLIVGLHAVEMVGTKEEILMHYSNFFNWMRVRGISLGIVPVEHTVRL